jgi:hypothetical protein
MNQSNAPTPDRLHLCPHPSLPPNFRNGWHVAHPVSRTRLTLSRALWYQGV